MRLAIDFDGTIVEADYPEIGELRVDAKKYINMLHEDGHMIIINTCRALEYELKAVNFLAENGIWFDLVNNNDPDMIREFGMDCRKISADIYIDDKNLASMHYGLLPWAGIYRVVTEIANGTSPNRDDATDNG